ncbi:MAG: hypothetical protein AAGH17_07495, partial [Pseudomonadota bacterium]
FYDLCGLLFLLHVGAGKNGTVCSVAQQRVLIFKPHHIDRKARRDKHRQHQKHAEDGQTTVFLTCKAREESCIQCPRLLQIFLTKPHFYPFPSAQGARLHNWSLSTVCLLWKRGVNKAKTVENVPVLSRFVEEGVTERLTVDRAETITRSCGNAFDSVNFLGFPAEFYAALPRLWLMKL